MLKWVCLGGALVILSLSGALKLTAMDRDTWKAKATASLAAVATSERNRATETRANKTAASEAEAQCLVRIKEARRSAGAIKVLVEKPREPSTPGAQPRISADELRDALQPGR